MISKEFTRLLSLCADMAGIIYRYQHMMKPREADKARQARQLINKWKKKRPHAGNAPSTAQAGKSSTARSPKDRKPPEYAPAGTSRDATVTTSP